MTSQKTEMQSDPVSDLVYLLGHDLRASIRAVIEVPAWLEEEQANLTDRSKDYLRLLRDHGMRLDQMVQAFTTYASVTQKVSGNGRCPSEVVSDRLKEARFAPHWEIDLRVSATELPMAREDASLLFSALFENANNHASHSAARLLVKVQAQEQSLRITIADNGPGIAAEHREQALQPMVKLTSCKRSRGVGLGLTIVDRIVENYGGSLELAVAEGDQGLAVDIILPL